MKPGSQAEDDIINSKRLHHTSEDKYAACDVVIYGFRRILSADVLKFARSFRGALLTQT